MINSELLKIPQELFDLCLDKCIQFKEEHKVTNRVTAKTVTAKKPHKTIPTRFVTVTEKVWVDNITHSYKNGVFGIGLLNMIAFYTLEFGYTFKENVGTKWVFAKGERELTLDLGEKFTLSIYEGIESKTFITPITTNNVRTELTSTYTVAELAAKLGSPEDEVRTWLNGLGWVWNGVAVDTDTHVANVFSEIAKDGENVTADVLVNGKSFKDYNFGSLVFPFGQAGRDFVVDWVLYNEHVPPTSVPTLVIDEITGVTTYVSPLKWISEGDMGEAARHRIPQKSDVKATAVKVVEGEVAGYDETTHTFTYNPSKQAVLSFQPQLLPAQGKNDVYEVCIDLNTGDVYYSRFAALKAAEAKVLKVAKNVDEGKS